MCNNLWMQIDTPSTLTVELKDDGKGSIQGVEEKVTASGTKTTRALKRGDFPVTATLSKGSKCRVFVQLISTGATSEITVTSSVAGKSSRGPDVCTLRVEGANDVAATRVSASARS